MIKYEEMCSKPSKIKNEITDFLDLKSTHTNTKDVFIKPFDSHTIQGNPIRLLKKKIKIIYDERWRKRLNVNQIEEIDFLQSKTKY